MQEPSAQRIDITGDALITWVVRSPTMTPEQLSWFVDDTVTRTVARILRADLVVVDDIGLLSVGDDAAEGLYRLVDAAYEKRSIAISSNLHPAAYDELMPKTLATATVDRLLHHAHICQTTGKSVRLTQALAGQGVSPLS